jgi:ribosomal protein S18 acetylase RimI-like enzyme
LPNDVDLVLWVKPNADEYLDLYKKVGLQWGWTGRLLLSPHELEAKLYAPTNEVWLFKHSGIVKGFFEIDRSEEGKAELVYLGLLPEAIGKGYGKSFLDAAIATASENNNRVWLHTCEYDHPKALAIYLKAGFEIVSETMEEEYYPKGFCNFKRC